jgi:hypothetical protein
LPNNTAVAAASPANTVPQFSLDVRNSTATSSILFQNARTDMATPIRGLPGASKSEDGHLTSAVLARSAPSADSAMLEAATTTALALPQFSDGRNWLFAAIASAPQTTDAASARTPAQRPILGMPKELGRQPTGIQPLDAWPANVDQVPIAELDFPPREDDPLSGVATITEHTHAIDRFFAWLQSADTRGYAYWSVPPVFAALSWLAWHQLRRTRSEVPLVAGRSVPCKSLG